MSRDVLARNWSWVACLLLASTTSLAENVDPLNDGSQHAWAENLGWLNAEPNGDNGDGIQAGDSELSGWMWSENAGWISLSCKNTLTCSTVDYGVLNDGSGVLSGFAFSENLGWINFAPFTSGVTIDPASGDFDGYAWGENAGWISFNCTNTGTCGATPYKITTEWKCAPAPAAPAGSPQLSVEKAGSDALLGWDRLTGATGFDVAHGTLGCLRANGGDFAACSTTCLDDNRTTVSLRFAGTPPAGDAFWFLVRGQNCGGNGTYDSGGTSQVAPRDVSIGASIDDCP